MRPETIEVLRVNLLDISLDNDFFGSGSKSKGNKGKTSEPHQIKKLLHNKGNQQGNEWDIFSQLNEREYLCHVFDKRLIYKVYKLLM